VLRIPSIHAPPAAPPPDSTSALLVMAIVTILSTLVDAHTDLHRTERNRFAAASRGGSYQRSWAISS
jgi:hypothetical protein